MAETRTPDQMDDSADLAEAELAQWIPGESTSPEQAVLREGIQHIAIWWNRWYQEAGHKRLGRIILKFKER